MGSGIGQAVHSFEYGRQVAADFTRTAAGEEGYQGPVRVKAVFLAEGGTIEFGFDFAGERVADVGGVDAALAEPGFFKGEDAEQVIQMAAHGFDAAFAPGPGLGCDKVDDRDVGAVEFARDAQVEVRAVSEDGHGGFFLARGGDELAELAPDAGDVGDDLDQADHVELRLIHHGADAGLGHARAGAAEEVPIGVAGLEDAREGGGVDVAGGFAGREQDFGAGGEQCARGPSVSLH